MLRATLLVVLLLSGTALAAPGKPPTAKEMEALDRDEAAAEAAMDAGDLQKALRYVDYFGHEQEAFATAMLEYGKTQRALRRAVEKKFGEETWTQAAKALGVPHHDRDKEKRTVRRENGVVYVKNLGAEHEAPYVNVKGVWKVSVRDILLTALKARFGPNPKVEEADLHVLSGKMAKVIQKRSDGVAQIADSVESGGITSPDSLRAAIDALRSGGAAR